MMAVSTLVEVLGEGFIKYMDAFKPFLYLGLKNHQEYQVCGTAVGLTGDIFRALKLKVSKLIQFPFKKQNFFIPSDRRLTGMSS